MLPFGPPPCLLESDIKKLLTALFGNAIIQRTAGKAGGASFRLSANRADAPTLPVKEAPVS
jgi:hypothetical protein